MAEPATEVKKSHLVPVVLKSFDATGSDFTRLPCLSSPVPDTVMCWLAAAVSPAAHSVGDRHARGRPVVSLKKRDTSQHYALHPIRMPRCEVHRDAASKRMSEQDDAFRRVRQRRRYEIGVMTGTTGGGGLG